MAFLSKSFKLQKGVANFSQVNLNYVKVRTTSFGVESIAYLGNKLWQKLPQEIKQSSSLPIFKNKLDVGMVEMQL